MAKAFLRSSDTNAWCETKAVLTHTNFKWVITNFRFCSPQNAAGRIQSPKFSSGPNKMYTWKLELCCTESDGKFPKSEETLELRIFPSSNIKYALVKGIVTDDSENELGNFTYEMRGHNKILIWTIKRKPQMKESDLKSLPNDLLVFYFYATISHNQVSAFIESRDVSCKKTQDQVLNYFSNLLNMELFSDFMLKVRSRKFPVHKVILAANSSVFEALFKRKETNDLMEITDFEEDAVYSLLSFMYTHKEPQFTSVTSAIRLFEIADKYAVRDLKELCKKHLVSILHAGKAGEKGGSTEAVKLPDESLLKEVLSFIRSHPENEETLFSFQWLYKIVKLQLHYEAEFLYKWWSVFRDTIMGKFTRIS